MLESVAYRWNGGPWEDGGCENALGCGLKVDWFGAIPRAVAFSSSSSSSDSEPPSYGCRSGGGRRVGEIFSLELLKTWSSSLSVSSYSSWLLVPSFRAARASCDGRLAPLRRRRSFCTRRPVVTISSPMDESEDDDG